MSSAFVELEAVEAHMWKLWYSAVIYSYCTRKDNLKDTRDG